MKSFSVTYLYYFITITCFLLLFIYTSETAFFWDTVQLGSLHATFYFENNFNEILLPQKMDSGHIPAFGMYIAMIWKLFGRSLLVSHLAMLPFIAGLFWQMHRLASYFFVKNKRGIVFLLLLIDSVIVSQTTLIGPDLPLTVFFLMAFNYILRNEKSLLTVAVLLLFLTSMRGMMLSFCLLFVDIWLNVELSKKWKETFFNLLRRSFIYLPSLALFIAFSYYHYSVKGWIGYHDDSPWANAFESVGFKGFSKNIFVYVWRLMDYGKFFPFLIVFILGSFYFKKYWRNEKSKTLIMTLSILFFVFPINMVWAQDLLAHRYLLPITITFTLCAAYFLLNSNLSQIFKNSTIALWIIIMLSGNFWIYPDKVAQGWDSTLAHLPYFELQKETIQYLDQNKIDFNDVETFFPSQGAIDFFYLNNDHRIIDGYEEKREYLIYSNINNVSDDQYDLIHSDQYQLLKYTESKGVFIKIFKKVK